MDIPYTVQARPDTGLYNAKIGIWLFLASEVMLFGGLFSAYIFLRVGADYPWPVWDLDVKLGLINTVVLIASSVTVVMAWASLKLRRFGQYKLYMAFTVLCAGAFMFNKSLEYSAKFKHYAVKLTDGTILTGHLPEDEHHKTQPYRIQFGEVTALTLTIPVRNSAVSADPVSYVVPHLEGEPRFKTSDGREILLDAAAFAELRTDALNKAAAEKKESATVQLTAVTPLKAAAKPVEIFGYTDTTMTFRDGTVATGRLLDDRMTLLVDGIDTRGVAQPEKSLAFEQRYLGAWQPAFVANRDHHIAEFEKHFPTRDKSKSATLQKESLFLKLHSSSPPAAAGHSAEGGHQDAHAEAAADHGHGHDYPTVVIDKKDITFFSNFTPKLNTYYAIYFTLTGLHGLHVVAGALVLGYFLVFNGRMMRENPEHLANRVEVGGLFWHFVDLVWIFLFPLLYLL